MVVVSSRIVLSLAIARSGNICWAPAAGAAAPRAAASTATAASRRNICPSLRPRTPAGEPSAAGRLLGHQQLAPAILDPAQLPDRERGCPHQHEQGHDQVAKRAEVEVVDPR